MARKDRTLLWRVSGTAMLAAAMLTAAPNAAHADGPCPAVSALVGQAQANFPDLGPGSVGPEAAPVLDRAEGCTVSLSLSGAKSFQCVWSYAQGSGAAPAEFGRLNGAVRDCLGDRARIVRDQPVNHPDYFDLREYRLDGVVLTVSLKEKSARRKTYVVFRIQADGAT